MKKLLLFLFLALFSSVTWAQVLPSFQFGLKGGFNLSKFSTNNTFASENKQGYYAGIWTRIGAAGIHVQPEVYYSEKKSVLKSNTGLQNEVSFNSIDVPVLIGTKIGAAGVGIRLNTGPMISFILNSEQSFEDAASNIFSGKFKDQNLAWQFGIGADIGKLNADLRYELGLTDLNKAGYPNTKLNMFTLGIGLRLF